MKKLYNLLISCFLLIISNHLSAQALYCVPVYTTGCSTGVGMSRFQIGNIDQLVNCDGVPNAWYHFYQDTATMIAGVLNDVTVTMNSPNTYVVFWLDGNDNNIFDPDEQCCMLLNTYANIPVTLQLSLSGNTPAGIHRIRFRTCQSQILTSPCATYGTGNAADFLVKVEYGSVPNAVNLLSPADGASNMMSDIDFHWEPGTGLPPTGYYFSLRTDNPPTTVLDDIWVNQPVYHSNFELDQNTTYYWEVKPFNDLYQPGPGVMRSFTTIAGLCTLEGYVYNTDGLPVCGAEVTISGPSVFSTATNADGTFSFNSIPFGSYALSCSRVHYNTYLSSSNLNFSYPITYYAHPILTKPVLSLSPENITDTLPPNGFHAYPAQVINSGTGPLEWFASVSYSSPNHDWLTLQSSTGQTEAGEQQNLPAILNADGLSSGTELDAVITLTSVPDAGTRSIPVNLKVAGNALTPVTNAVGTLTNPNLGFVNLSWDCIPSSGFQYYSVSRDGIEISRIPIANNCQDTLDSYGLYSYTIQAVYTAGSTAPAQCWINRPNTVLSFSPAQLFSQQESNTVADVTLNIHNTGQGSLVYEFPDYFDRNNHIPQNYCVAAANAQDEFISRVQIGTINQVSGWNGYSDYTSVSTELHVNLPTAIIVTIGPPNYSSDIAGVWIDYDHNGTFDNTEFTQLSGTSTATGTIVVPQTALPGLTRMRVRLQYGGTLSPCGSTAYGEVEDYAVNIIANSFITDVIPAIGTVPEGGSATITLHFSATGQYSANGTYNSTLQLQTNDTNHQNVNLPATMIVGPLTRIQGTVTSCGNGNPIPDMYITAGTKSTYSDQSGNYSLLLDPGSYEVKFREYGYQLKTETAVTITAGNTTLLNESICPVCNPPTNVSANVRPDDSVSFLSWSPPDASYELYYDDAVPENFVAWQQAGNMNAVKFTPAGYPAVIKGARFFIGSGSAGTCIGSRLTALVFKSTPEGYPGLLADSASIIVTGTGWVEIDGLDATILDGDFFIAMKQNEPAPDCPFLGVESTSPMAWKSYSKNSSNGSWGISPYQDFMIRALVQSQLTGGDNMTDLKPVRPTQFDGLISLEESLPADLNQENVPKAAFVAMVDSVQSYKIWRISNFDPNLPPSNGVLTLIASGLTDLNYIENGYAWQFLPAGYYAYAVSANYEGGQISEHQYSNAVSHRIYSNLTLNVQIACNGNAAEGALVKLRTPGHPAFARVDTIPSSGTLILQNLPRQDYVMEVRSPGHRPYTQSFSLDSNLILNIALEGYKSPPRNAYLDDQSLVFMWNEPLSIILNEDFESGNFLPPGWQSSSQGSSVWNVSTNGNSAYFNIPPHTTYAFTNDDQGGPGNNGCCDYLITPELDLTGAPAYIFYFQSFFTGGWGETATVEMSTDDGNTWIPIYSIYPGSAWTSQDIDLTPYSGPTGLSSVKFAFHSNDNGNYGSGWAIDDVGITSGYLPVYGYAVFLDGAMVGNTPADTRVWVYDPATVNYGQSYTACVAALYCDGYSGASCSSITNQYLEPPSDLTVQDSTTPTYGAAILNWAPMVPSQSDTVVLSIKIYRNSDFIAEVPSWQSMYPDEGLAPGDYWYQLSAVYNISQWGFPGQTDESMKTEPQYINLVYGMGIPFVEDFSSGQIDTTKWNVGQNWMIDEQTDNPVPSAKFNAFPVLTNYSSALESNWINTLALDSTGPYNIWLDYELRLKDTLETGNENLNVEVWDGIQWQAVENYTNSGSFDWTTEHINISELSKNREFRIRFRADGLASADIQYWSVDNIRIYTETSLIAPVNLVAELVAPANTSVSLSWQLPYSLTSTGNDLLNTSGGIEERFRIHSGDNQSQLTGPASNKSLVARPANEYMQPGQQPGAQQNSSILINYNIFRNQISKSPGTTGSTGNFQLIGSTDSTMYIDTPPDPFGGYEYYVTAVYDNGESQPSNWVFISLWTSINKALAERVKVYPNPTHDKVNVEFPTGTASIRLYNPVGVCIFEKKLKGEDHLAINTSALPSGVYSIQMTSGNREFYGCKLVILK